MAIMAINVIYLATLSPTLTYYNIVSLLLFFIYGNETGKPFCFVLLSGSPLLGPLGTQS